MVRYLLGYDILCSDVLSNTAAKLKWPQEVQWQSVYFLISAPVANAASPRFKYLHLTWISWWRVVFLGLVVGVFLCQTSERPLHSRKALNSSQYTDSKRRGQSIV